MTDQEDSQVDRHLEPCPFCGLSLDAEWNRKNPRARCRTEGCKGAQLPVLNLDQPSDIAAWNTRPPLFTLLAPGPAALGQLPEYARSGQGQRCYSLGYAQGRKKGNDEVRAALASSSVVAPTDETLRLAGVIADKIEDGTLFQAGIFSRRDLAEKVRSVVRFAQQSALQQAQAAMNDFREG